MNIVVPMAGRGSRFVNAGFELPKPLIPINNRAMIEVVIENLRPSRPHRYIFLCLAEHIEKYAIDQKLKSMVEGAIVVPVNEVTEGAACTVLLASEYIDNDDSLMIANSDQWVDFSIDTYLAIQDWASADGLIMTMWADDPKWSYVNTDSNGLVREVAEKIVISHNATVGIYNYQKGSEFVHYAEDMIDKDLRVNGEFYVAPVYNQMIQDGKRIVTCSVGSEGNGMYGFGIPEDLQLFLNNPISKVAVSNGQIT